MLNHRRLLNLIIFFQLGTLGLFYFGPITYVSPSINYIAALLVGFYLLMLKIGALAGGRCYFRGRSGPQNPIRFFRLSIAVTLLLLPATIVSRGGDLSSASALGDIYTSSAARREASGSSFEYVRMLFGYILFGFFPITLVFWSELTRRLKFFAILGILLNVFLAFVTGVNKYIFDYIIIFSLWRYLLSGQALFRGRKGWVTIFVVAAAFASAGYFFTQGQLTRYGSAAVSGANPSINSYSEYSAEDGDVLVFYSSLSSYLTQGYRALDLATYEPFVFSWGVGNSTFFSRQADRILDVNVSDQSYPARIEKYGWDRYNQWSSFYLWWASDLSLIGVGFLMFFVGFLYSAIGNTLGLKRDPASIILMSYLLIALMYLSANNQVMQSGESAVGFLALLIPYILKRRLRKMP